MFSRPVYTGSKTSFSYWLTSLSLCNTLYTLCLNAPLNDVQSSKIHLSSCWYTKIVNNRTMKQEMSSFWSCELDIVVSDCDAVIRSTWCETGKCFLKLKPLLRRTGVFLAKESVLGPVHLQSLCWQLLGQGYMAVWPLQCDLGPLKGRQSFWSGGRVQGALGITYFWHFILRASDITS